MQAQPNVFLVQTPQVVGQTRVIPVGNITTSQAQERSANRDVHVAGIMEILFRGLCTLVSLGVIISAAVAIPAINQVKENTIYGYEDADSYRRAAGWLIFVASVTLLYHIVVIIVRVLYMASVLKKHLRIYGAINAILVILFGLSLLLGGIANVVYAADNGDYHTDLCFHGNAAGSEFCSDLERVVAREASSGALSLFMVILHMILFCLVICTAIGQCSQTNMYSTQSHFATSHQPTHIYPPTTTSQLLPPGPSYLSTNPPSQYVPPSAPYYPPANVPPHMSALVQPPANAPSYTSAEPPSYESVVTSQYIKSSSGDPPGESKTGIVS